MICSIHVYIKNDLTILYHTVHEPWSEFLYWKWIYHTMPHCTWTCTVTHKVSFYIKNDLSILYMYMNIIENELTILCHTVHEHVHSHTTRAFKMKNDLKLAWFSWWINRKLSHQNSTKSYMEYTMSIWGGTLKIENKGKKKKNRKKKNIKFTSAL